MVRRTRRTEMPKQLTEFDFVKSKIVEWEQNGKDATMATFQDGAFTSYEAGDCPNAFLIGSILEEDSRIVLKKGYFLLFSGFSLVCRLLLMEIMVNFSDPRRY